MAARAARVVRVCRPSSTTGCGIHVALSILTEQCCHDTMRCTLDEAAYLVATWGSLPSIGRHACTGAQQSRTTSCGHSIMPAEQSDSCSPGVTQIQPFARIPCDTYTCCCCWPFAGDTRGIVGPETTWREVQWTKVRLLVREFGLTPWYCKRYPDFCATVEWRH